MTRTRKLVSNAFGLCAAAIVAIAPAQAHDAFTAWAQSAQEIAFPGGRDPRPMVIEDRFTERLAFNGMKAETGCSGSRWVYDYAHHIAAGFDGGPEMILYMSKPPVKLPSRDLSHVSTALGIRLGETPNQVIAALKVPLFDLTRLSNHRQFLYLGKPIHHTGDPHVYYDLGMIVFNDNRVISIRLAHNEN